MPFWKVVMEATTLRDESLTRSESEWYDQIYELVFMGGEDPVDAESRGFGIVGAQSLRDHIRDTALDQGPK